MSRVCLVLLVLSLLPPALHAQSRGQVYNGPGGVYVGPSRTANPGAGDTLSKISPFPDALYVAAVPNLPFTATSVSDRTSVRSITPNSTTGQVTFYGNHRMIARDSAGHIMMEQRALIHDGQKQDSDLLAIEFIDPASMKFLRCRPLEKTCYLYSLRKTQMGYITYLAEDRPILGVPPEMISKLEGATVKSGGQKALEDIRTDVYHARFEMPNQNGAVITRTPNSDAARNVEFYTNDVWYSPELQMDLKMSYSNGNGDHTETIKDLKRGEPDAKLFSVPAGYKVVDGATAK